MNTMLVTGVSGNIGREVVRFLQDSPVKQRVVAAQRDRGQEVAGRAKLN